MNQLVKKSIGVVASLAIISIGVYGTYLPMQKSLLFINAQKQLNRVHSLDDFMKTESMPLDYPSPVGQEELVRQTANTVLETIQQYGQNPDLIKSLIDYLNRYYQPILRRGRGMSFEQNLFLLGIINETSFFKTKNPQYLADAQKYYEQGRSLGPKRPQSLYGLFDVYRAEGNWEQAKIVGEQILSQWPTDVQVSSALAQFTSSSTEPNQR